MQTMIAPINRRPGRWTVPAMALLMLPLLATAADAQRGRGGHGGSGSVGRSPSSHHGGHGTRGHHGARGHRGHHTSRGDHGYRGQRGHHGYRGGHGYRGHRGNVGHHGYRGRSHTRGYTGYRGYRGYSSFYLSPSRSYRPFSPYVYYSSPGYWGVGAYVYPGISVDYHAAPRYVVRDRGYRIVEPKVYEGESIAGSEAGVTERGEPVSGDVPLDARQPAARLQLTIEPGDASIYLDGAFLGLASELPATLLLDAGAHRLEVARPGYAGRDIDLDLEAGEELEVDARLVADR